MIRGSRAVGRQIVASLVAVTAIALAGCAPNPTPAPTRSQVSATGSLAPPATAVRPSASVAVEVDQALLAVVPSAVDGVPLTFDPETSASLAGDPSVAADARSLAVALAIVPGASAAEDLAIVNIVKLREPSRDDAWFRDWRDTYDEGACGQAGGVAGNAEAQIGGATVFIGSCGGGTLTYHTRLVEAGIVVSVTALGSRRLGEKVMAGVRR